MRSASDFGLLAETDKRSAGRIT